MLPREARDTQRVLAQLDEDSIVYKLNTLPLSRCLLLSRAEELRDGLVFAEILCACDPRLSATELAADLLCDSHGPDPPAATARCSPVCRTG